MNTTNLKLVLYPDELLKKACAPVQVFDETLHQVLDQMRGIMEEHKGIGLSANQVGISQSFFIMKDKHGEIFEFINPQILSHEGFAQLNEGCLSAPGIYVQVHRSRSVHVKAQKRNGEFFEVVAEELEAVCIQHEMDHLLGIFYLDRVNRQQRRAAMKRRQGP